MYRSAKIITRLACATEQITESAKHGLNIVTKTELCPLRSNVQSPVQSPVQSCATNTQIIRLIKEDAEITSKYINHNFEFLIIRGISCETPCGLIHKNNDTEENIINEICMASEHALYIAHTLNQIMNDPLENELLVRPEQINFLLNKYMNIFEKSNQLIVITP